MSAMSAHVSFHKVEEILNIQSEGYSHLGAREGSGYVRFDIEDKDGNNSTIVLHCNCKKLADQIAKALEPISAY
jgi:hypothetical protein